VSDLPDDSRLIALPIFEDLLLFVPNSLFLFGFFDSDKAFFS
jgi:hypothetical protein